MDKKCTMIGLKKEEEMELDLGLSIGGGFKRLEKVPNPIKNEPVPFQRTRDPKNSSFDTDLRDNHPNLATDLELEKMVVDPQVKREIDALRKQEAKKKRQKKQQHKGMTKNEEYINGGFGVIHDNKMWLKSPELESRERDFDVNERECKKSRVESRNYNVNMKNMNLNFTAEQNMNMNQNVTFSSNPTAFSASAVYPVMYPYPPVQFVQFPNGLPYPCVNVVPFWANGGVSIGNEQNMVQSFVNQSFRSYQSGQGHLPVFNVGDGCASDQNSRKAGSNGSPMCSSSVVSDYRSSFHEGGSSSDNKSHSIFSLPEPPLHGSKVNDTKGQSDHSTSSHMREAARTSDETTNCFKPKVTSNNSQCSPAANCASIYMEQKIPASIFQFSPTKPEEGAVIESRPASENPLSTTENGTSGLLKESKREIGKPPKPQMSQNQNTPSLPQMPCVSITGNGPNGKTINGLLYRYTKTEVIIMCLCHGTSFSPAEFVRHAGGTDLSNPLKHITVIPSGF